MGARISLDGIKQKGDERASAPSHARRHVQNGLVFGAPYREAMREINPEPLGGEGKFVEADETYTGGKAKNRAYKDPPPKEAVM
jgi:hypothetical protein